MSNDKSPRNDGLTKEFFETFWSKVKKKKLSCVSHSFDKGELCTSQRQAIIKLIKKKDSIATAHVSSHRFNISQK